MRRIFRLIPFLAGSLVFLVLLVLPGCGKNNADNLVAQKTLAYWGVWDEPTAMNHLIASYRRVYPHINIVYTKIPFEEYEQTLYDAWVRGTGPDIFSISNTWVKKYAEFIAPMPPVTVMGRKQVTKKLGIKEEVEIVQDTNPSPVPQNVVNDYVEAVHQDVIIGDQIYGLPYSVDTLVMFYNKDLLASAGIPLPPETWQEFVQDVPRLTIQDKEGAIVQSGAALGTPKNVSRSVDILSLLMIQNGTNMIDPMTGVVSINQPIQGGAYLPGAKALEFYTDFASPTKEVYTWNDKMPNSLEAFVSGQVAFFFGYAYHIPQIESRGSVNYGLAPVPQITASNPKNFTNYWLATVSNKSAVANDAWDFIKFAVRPEVVEGYLSISKKPTALKVLVEKQLQDFDLNIFAEQALTARSWYHGRNPLLMEETFQKMIEVVNSGDTSPHDAVQESTKQIQASL